jgi:flagellar hook-associated protein FlgK
MNTLSTISQSGLQAAQTRLDAAAHNIANAQTPHFQRLNVEQQTQADGGVTAQVARSAAEGGGMESDVVAQLQAHNSLLANLSVFKTQDRMLGSVLDAKA